MPTLTTFIQHSIKSLAKAIMWEKEIKDIHIEKEEVKLSFTHGLILFIFKKIY